MNKKKLLAMLAAKEQRKTALLAKADGTEDIKELRSINAEMAGVTTEINDIKGLIEEIEVEERAAADADPVVTTKVDPETKTEARKVMGTYGMDESPEDRKKLTTKYETRGATLKAGKSVDVSMVELPEERAVTVASATLVIQKKYSNTLNEAFNEVSSLLDNVNAIPLIGGNSYTKGFEVSFDEADYTTETGAYTDGDPVVGYVDIGKAKITAYTEITDEAQKLPNIDYLGLVVKNVRIAIRKKITKMILTGAGGSNAITGIFNAAVTVIPTASDLEVSEIDVETLDSIVFGYGGDEDVEGGAVLILNKADLAAFSAVRFTDGKRAYKITLERGGNMGTLSSEGSFEVPFILNSAAPALSAAGTTADTLCMAYGKLLTYEMPVFSPLTVEESRDFKFSTGQIAYRGSIWVGGSVASYKGFVRVKKVAP